MEIPIVLKNETLKTNVVSLLMHSGLLNYFEYKGMYELCDVNSKEIYYTIYLKEKATQPFGMYQSDMEFIGYLSPICIQDLPIRKKSVILHLTLKGWLKKDNKQELIISKYPFFTEDLIFTKKLFEKIQQQVSVKR